MSKERLTKRITALITFVFVGMLFLFPQSHIVHAMPDMASGMSHDMGCENVCDTAPSTGSCVEHCVSQVEHVKHVQAGLFELVVELVIQDQVFDERVKPDDPFVDFNDWDSYADPDRILTTQKRE